MKMLDDLKFDRDGLMPAIVQESDTGEVLMLAYMNREALSLTMQSGRTYFYSRSRKKLWCKGETSGNSQTVEAVFTDCDSDTILVKVRQKGAACHEGYRTCFHKKAAGSKWEIVGLRMFNPEDVYGRKE